MVFVLIFIKPTDVWLFVFNVIEGTIEGVSILEPIVRTVYGVWNYASLFGTIFWTYLVIQVIVDIVLLYGKPAIFVGMVVVFILSRRRAVLVSLYIRILGEVVRDSFVVRVLIWQIIGIRVDTGELVLVTGLVDGFCKGVSDSVSVSIVLETWTVFLVSFERTVRGSVVWILLIFVLGYIILEVVNNVQTVTILGVVRGIDWSIIGKDSFIYLIYIWFNRRF